MGSGDIRVISSEGAAKAISEDIISLQKRDVVLIVVMDGCLRGLYVGKGNILVPLQRLDETSAMYMIIQNTHL